MRARRPSRTPRASAAASISTRASRACDAAARFSRRVSVHLTGRSIRRAAAATARSSGITCIFWPKPPPVSGTMTRTCRSASPKAWASAARTMCGTCVPVHTVRASPSQRAITPRGSSGEAERRAWWKVSLTTTAAAAKRALDVAVAVAALEEHVAAHASACSRGASSASAASMVATAGSDS